jgi:hypothetical protein
VSQRAIFIVCRPTSATAAQPVAAVSPDQNRLRSNLSLRGMRFGTADYLSEPQGPRFAVPVGGKVSPLGPTRCTGVIQAQPAMGNAFGTLNLTSMGRPGKLTLGVKSSYPTQGTHALPSMMSYTVTGGTGPFFHDLGIKGTLQILTELGPPSSQGIHLIHVVFRGETRRSVWRCQRPAVGRRHPAPTRLPSLARWWIGWESTGGDWGRSMNVLKVKHFAQIDDARVEFGDLTVLVGPQASGKSLLLQWLKVAIDIGEVAFALEGAGHDIKTGKSLIDLIFGEGMSGAWIDGKTEIRFDGDLVSPQTWARGLKKKKQGRVYFIPAHRALLLAEGWPAPFLKLNADTPVVARLFSQSLYERFSGRQAAPLFPLQRMLKQQGRDLIDEAVYHGGKVELEKEGLRYRLRLAFNGLALPFMSWTAGQREFTPLLLGLSHLVPPGKLKRRKEIDWVVIEEPEMGLHPQAIVVLMLLVLDLLWRGYKVVISTHSPLVLDIIWAIRRLHEHSSRWQALGQAFGVKERRAMRAVLEHALRADYRVYFCEADATTGRVTTRDISELDPDASDDGEATWGGLTGFSSQFGEAVRSTVNQDEG